MFNLTIKTKLYALSAVVTLSLIVLIIFTTYSLNYFKQLDQAQLLLKSSEVDMLLLRRHEKDFLARSQLKYVDKFSLRFNQLTQHLNQLSNDLVSLNITESQEINTLTNSINTYSSSFNLLVTAKKQSGLDPKSGHRGDLRKAVHQAEQDLSQLDDNDISQLTEATLQSNILTLRRNEKDFLLRRTQVSEFIFSTFMDNYHL